jgi:DNA invertase Pin-like site-specific DNA recombinase
MRTVLDLLRKGDVLMVTRIDRLARSIGDLQDIARTVKACSESLKATGQPIDTSTAAGKCFLDMLGCSQSSRRTYVENVSLRASRGRRRRAYTRDGLGRLMWPKCAP